MQDTEDKNKSRGGEVVWFEPRNMEMVIVDPTIQVAFEKIACIVFYEKV